jgi:hypothetical protein
VELGGAMNTPAHLVLNAAVLGRGRWRAHWLPIALGAVLPDFAMVGFYLWQRAVVGASERTIWSETYFEPSWQALFDAFHSFPLIAGGAAAASWLGSPRGLALFASMALHSLCDLPLHHDDAHAHFFPLSPWRFASPVSYWDAGRHGGAFMAAELAIVLAGAAALWRRAPPAAWRALALLAAASYVALAVFAALTWARLGP